MASLTRKIGLASLIMMASVFLSRVIGLLREMVIAYVGGASAYVDAYQIGFILPEILNHVVASGFLSITFIPIFSHYLVRGREEEGWQIFSTILTVFGSLLVLLIIVGEIFSPQIVHWLAPGLKATATLELATTMTRIILPAQFFFFAGGLLMAVQFAKEQFTIPALAPLIYNAGIIAGGVCLSPLLGMAGFSWGVLIGAFIGNFWLQLIGARRIGLRFHLSWQWHHPDLKRYVLLTLPLMLGLTMTFSTEIFLKFFGSFLPPGSIAGLNYGLRIMFILVGFFGQAVGVASYPFLARLAAEGDLQAMNRLLNQTLRYLAVVIPFSVLLIVLRQEVVQLLFQRGNFDATATALTARVMIWLMAGAFAFAAQTVVVRGFYATQNTLLPALFGTIAVIAGLPLYWLGLQTFGIAGVALACSISAAIQVVMLFSLWNRRSKNPYGRQVYVTYIKMALFSLVAGGILYGVRELMAGHVAPGSLSGTLATTAVTGLAFVGLLLFGGRYFRLAEITHVIDRLWMIMRSQSKRH